MSKFQPVIKWSGSKRSQASEIIKHFPNEMNVYYEPFVGGGSIMRTLLESNNKFNHVVCSDINEGLINLWKSIKERPDAVVEHYSYLWNLMNVNDDKEAKKRFFENIRDRYNKEHNPLDFMFIMRTTTNGMPRYNSKGEFNNSFHVTRDGINPLSLVNIVHEWSELLNKYNVEFRCCSYEEIKPNENDFVYLDPPYANTKGMYFGGFDNTKLFEWMRNLPCPYLLSYDGRSGEVDNTFEVPKDLYTEHLYIRSGNSSFKRVIGKSNDSIVYESLYKKV